MKFISIFLIVCSSTVSFNGPLSRCVGRTMKLVLRAFFILSAIAFGPSRSDADCIRPKIIYYAKSPSPQGQFYVSGPLSGDAQPDGAYHSMHCDLSDLICREIVDKVKDAMSNEHDICNSSKDGTQIVGLIAEKQEASQSGVNKTIMSTPSPESEVAQAEAAKFYSQYQASAYNFTFSDIAHSDMAMFLQKAHPTTAEIASFYENRLAKAGKIESISSEDRQKFTSYGINVNGTINPTDPVIKNLANLLIAGRHTDIEKLMIIHNFVLWRLSYPTLVLSASVSTPKKKWMQCVGLGGNVGMALPPECGVVAPFDIQGERLMYDLYSGVDNCYGYAYLFASLARAAGIPTREAHQPWTIEPVYNSRVGHQWVQVYVSSRWSLIDPTYDDRYDQGQYDNSSIMNMDFSYFLITPEEAIEIDRISAHGDPYYLKTHAPFEIENM